MPFVTMGGENIYYKTGGVGDKPLILVHGAGGSSAKWSNQVANLTDFRVLAVDLPGHGQSGGELLPSIPSMAAFIDNFAEALGLSRFVLGGHSMGGGIALEFALRYPAQLFGIVLIGTGARLRVNPAVLAALAQGKSPFSGAEHLYGPNTPDYVLENAAQEIKQVDPRVYWVDFNACDQFDRIEEIAGITLPALIIGGEADRMTPAKYSVFLHDKLSNSQLLLLPGVGHMCMEEQPDSVNSAIRQFGLDL